MAKSNRAVGLPIYDLVLLSNSNHMSISHSLLALENCPTSLIIRPKFQTSPHSPLPQDKFFTNLNGFLPGSEGRLPSKLIFFRYFSNTYT